MAPDRTTRRAFLSASAGAVGIGVLAGCILQRPEPREPEPTVDVATTLDGDTAPEVWHDVERIGLDGYVGGWVGVEPTAIERVENPTLVLFESRSYELSWVNRDGMHHNLAFWDADEEVVDGYSTPGTDVEGAGETLTVEPTREMATYRCEYQSAGQLGEVLVVDDGDR